MSRKSLIVVLLFLISAGTLSAQESEPAIPSDAPASERFWVGAEYLLWWIKDGPVPGPLVTSSPPGPAPGVLGAPGTIVLFGNEGLNYKGHSGGQFTLGSWFDDRRTVGFELAGMFLETHTIHFAIDSDKTGAPVIARPFFNVLTGAQDAQVLTSPNSFFGGIDVFSDSRFWSAESNFLARLLRSDRLSVELLAGLRYLGLDESLRISQSSTVRPGAPALPAPPGFNGTPVPAPDILSLTDRFETRNEFFGGQVGVRGVVRYGRWSFDWTGKVGLGDTKQWVNLMGNTELTGPTGRLGVNYAGLFAVGDNRWLYSRDRVTFMSEAGFRLGCAITEYWSVQVGYKIIYWGDVARPGEQMSLAINPQLVPSNLAFGPVTAAPEPLRRFASSDFWAMGLTIGLTFQY